MSMSLYYKGRLPFKRRQNIKFEIFVLFLLSEYHNIILTSLYIFILLFFTKINQRLHYQINCFTLMLHYSLSAIKLSCFFALFKCLQLKYTNKFSPLIVNNYGAYFQLLSIIADRFIIVAI